MKREDAVFTIGNLILAVALLPSIFSNDKPSAVTSLLTGAVLASFSCCFTRIGYHWSAWITGASAWLWFILFTQAL